MKLAFDEILNCLCFLHFSLLKRVKNMVLLDESNPLCSAYRGIIFMKSSAGIPSWLKAFMEHSDTGYFTELQAVDVNEGEVIFAVCLPVKYILGIIVQWQDSVQM